MPDCPGRLGRIIQAVRDLSNEAGPGFISDEFVVRSVNRCLEDTAQFGYWRKDTVVSWPAAGASAATAQIVPDCVEILGVYTGAGRAKLVQASSYREFTGARLWSGGATAPHGLYLASNGKLYIHPEPAEGSEFIVSHTYSPVELTPEEDSCNPPMPRAHDMMFVYFVLREAFLRDRHAPGADTKFQEFSGLFRMEQFKLLGGSLHAGLRLKSQIR